MEELNKSVFSKIFFEIIMNLDSRSNTELLSIKRDFKQYEENKNAPRLGLQSKIAIFFDCVRRKLEYIVENEFNNVLSNKEKYGFFSKIIEALGLIYYQSVKKNRGINYPNKESLEKIIGSFVSNTPKANENFANLLLGSDKKMSLTTMSEMSAFMCLISVIFNANVEVIENIILQELRKYVKIYINNKEFIEEVNGFVFYKSINISGDIYDFTEVLNKFCNIAKIDDKYFIMGKLLFVLLYFAESKTTTEAALESYIAWINNVQNEILSIANGYSKYLWIRYRRLPNVDLTAEKLNGYTIDNLYVFPNLVQIDKNKQEKLFDGFFDKNANKRMRRIVTSAYGAGKTSLLNAIISMIAINSDYAIRGMRISNYFNNYYKKMQAELGFKTTDVCPIVISCKKFDNFISSWKNKNENKRPTLLDFAYYLILSYNKELNIIGERNKGWYETWIFNFTFQQFKMLLRGAIEDDRLLLLIDDCETVYLHQEEFEDMVANFLSEYGSKCDIIVTATEREFLPQFIAQAKSGFSTFNIADLQISQAQDLFAKYYAYFKNSDEMQTKKQEVIDAYEFDEENTENKEKDFVKYILDVNENTKFLKEDSSVIKQQIYLNPRVLTKVAQNNAFYNCEFNISTVSNETFFEILPVLAENEEYAKIVEYNIPRRLIDVIEKANYEKGIDKNLIKNFQKLINGKKHLIKNNKIKQTLKTCNCLITYYLERETND